VNATAGSRFGSGTRTVTVPSRCERVILLPSARKKDNCLVAVTDVYLAPNKRTKHNPDADLKKHH